MIYGKIDENGDIIEYPYRLDPLQRNNLPADAVEVDVDTNRPAVNWDQKVIFESVERVGDNYLAVYGTPVDKFNTPEEKAKNIAIIKNASINDIKRTFENKSKNLKASYVEGEVDSWPVQRAEALAYSADNTASTPLLSVIATNRGITVDALVTKVLAKVTSYDTAYGELLGKYRKNVEILNAIDLEDDATWNLIDTMVAL
jgi:hypothetical protein